MTLGLNIEDIIAQCYDGAVNMRGIYKGVAARIKRDNPRAIYVHCNAHILNLVLVDAAKANIAARNTFGTISECTILWKDQQKDMLCLKRCGRNQDVNHSL